MGVGEQGDGFGEGVGGAVGWSIRCPVCRYATSAGLSGAEGEQGGVQAREDVIMQDAAGAVVENLAFGQALALEGHQAAGHFGAGLGVYEALAGGAGQFHFFLGVEAAAALVAQEQDANEAALAPEGDGPARAVILCWRDGQAELVWGAQVGKEAGEGGDGRRGVGGNGERRADERGERAKGDEIGDFGAQEVVADGAKGGAGLLSGIGF